MNFVLFHYSGYCNLDVADLSDYSDGDPFAEEDMRLAIANSLKDVEQEEVT